MNTGLYLYSASAFDGSGMPELPGRFARPLRRADSLTVYSVTAAYHCLKSLEDAGLEPDLKRCAVVAGFGIGTLETNLAFVDSLYEDESRAGSPTLFSHSVHNTVSGYVSRLFGIYGPAFTVTEFEWPFLSALFQARCCIESGLADMALVIGCEVESRFMQAVHAQFLVERGNSCPVRWTTGASAWLVGVNELFPTPAVLIQGPELNLCACKPDELLLRLTESYTSKEGGSPQVPFGYALSLNSTVLEVVEGKSCSAQWKAEAAFGTATLGVAMVRD